MIQRALHDEEIRSSPGWHAILFNSVLFYETIVGEAGDVQNLATSRGKLERLLAAWDREATNRGGIADVDRALLMDTIGCFLVKEARFASNQAQREEAAFRATDILEQAHRLVLWENVLGTEATIASHLLDARKLPGAEGNPRNSASG